MPNNKHLTLEDRIMIEKGLGQFRILFSAACGVRLLSFMVHLTIPRSVMVDSYIIIWMKADIYILPII